MYSETAAMGGNSWISAKRRMRCPSRPRPPLCTNRRARHLEDKAVAAVTARAILGPINLAAAIRCNGGRTVRADARVGEAHLAIECVSRLAFEAMLGPIVNAAAIFRNRRTTSCACANITIALILAVEVVARVAAGTPGIAVVGAICACCARTVVTHAHLGVPTHRICRSIGSLCYHKTVGIAIHHMILALQEAPRRERVVATWVAHRAGLPG